MNNPYLPCIQCIISEGRDFKRIMIKKFHISSISVIVSILSVILVVFCIFLIKDRKSNMEELKALEKKLAEMEKKKIETDAVKEEIKQISRYAAYEFSYTSVLMYSDRNQFMGMDIPLTENNFVATIDGKINIGINGDEVKFIENTDSEGKITGVNLFVPHSRILDNYTIQESLEIFDEKNNIFNPVRPENYNELLIEAARQEEAKILESDILKKSDETIKYLLISHFESIYGEGTEIRYTLTDHSSSTP